MKKVFTAERSPIIVPLAANSDGSNAGWKTILFNCYCHSFDEVVTHIMRATRCDIEKGTYIAVTAEIIGEAMVCRGTKEHCKNVASILGGVGLNVAVIQ